MKRFISFRQKRFLRIHALFLLFHLSFFTFHATSQPPQGISYQAIITDEADQPLEFSPVGIKVSILAGGPEGIVEYAETHSAITDQIGHVSLVIGTGDVVSGSFAGIPWADDMFWVKIETDPLGGTNYTISGTSQFLSVPYAFVSLTSLEPGPVGPPGKDGILADGTATGNTTFWDGTQWVVDSNNLFHDGTRVGIGTDEPAAQLHIYGIDTGEGNVLFTGELKLHWISSPGDPPASGPGTRMMWYPDKAAFRAGHVNFTNWDKDSIGMYSVAMGDNSRASGIRSTAFGSNTIATGAYSTAMGFYTFAKGWYTTSMGESTEAEGDHSTAMGLNTIAKGARSVSMGEGTVASSANEVVIGSYNSFINTTPRLFSVGMGKSMIERQNALTILTNGNTGIGTDTPVAHLHINGEGTLGGGNVLFDGIFTTTPLAPPAAGPGTRMMWYPGKAAIRAGRVTGAQWDLGNIGNYSVALGFDTQASGDYSTAMGRYSTASGGASLAVGSNAVASEDFSVAIGTYVRASGRHSTAFGFDTETFSFGETVIGFYSTPYIPVYAPGWHDRDRLFIIGNGRSPTDRRNAMTILKNGNTGIGIDHPSALLHVNGTGTGEGNVLFVGTQKTSPGFPPASGAGTRMMWYPDKAAFRAGRVTGAQWDLGNTGNYSVALGYDTQASGAFSSAIGANTSALSGYETVIGRFNTLYTPLSPTGWNAADRLFVVGRGTGTTTRLNALTILKNGNTGVGTDTPSALLHTSGTGTGEGNVLFAGSFKGTSPGNPPVSGAGTRMMWYPDKSAFRAGQVTGTQWDMGNIGNRSVALGINVTASGTNSVALGNNSTASGGSSVAFGSSTTASNTGSTAMGSSTAASGISSTAMGSGSIASGISSTAMGSNARAVGNYSFAINLNNNIGPNVAANNFRITGATAIGGNVAWTNYSDRRLKKEIVAIGSENNLSKILQLNAVRYRWIEHNQLLNLGFIAQDVMDIVPESVRYDELNDIYSMEYTALIPLLVEGMKEQQAVIEELRKENIFIKNQLRSLELTQKENRELRTSEKEIEQLKTDMEKLKGMFMVKE